MTRKEKKKGSYYPLLQSGDDITEINRVGLGTMIVHSGSSLCNYLYKELVLSGCASLYAVL